MRRTAGRPVCRVIFSLLLLLLTVLLGLSGCMMRFDGDAGGPAHVEWASSVSRCRNNVCTYGDHDDRLADSVGCGTATILSWNLSSRVHGVVRLWVEDDEGVVHHDKTLTGGGGNVDLTGSKGRWTLHADLADYNGVFEATLSCA